MSETTLPATVTFDELHALRIKGRASDEALGHMLGVSPYDAAIRRAALVSEGLAQYREGRMPGSSLTPDGRELHSALLTERLTDTAKRSAVEQGLADFLPINGALKRVCSSWQTREDDSPNRHDDAAYDASVIEQLTAVNADATALLRSAARIGEMSRSSPCAVDTSTSPIPRNVIAPSQLFAATFCMCIAQSAKATAPA